MFVYWNSIKRNKGMIVAILVKNLATTVAATSAAKRGSRCPGHAPTVRSLESEVNNLHVPFFSYSPDRARLPMFFGSLSTITHRPLLEICHPRQADKS